LALDRKLGCTSVPVTFAESDHGPSKAISYPCEIHLSKRGLNWFKDADSHHFEIGISRSALDVELFEGVAFRSASIASPSNQPNVIHQFPLALTA
jgi:hypothetical protein